MGAASRLTLLIARSFIPATTFSLGEKTLPANNDQPNVYLTFDDGPDAITTPLILDQLDALNIKATFFVEGKKAAANPALIHRTYNDGHSIGTHSWSHHSATTVTNKVWIEDVHKARSELEELLGTSCPLFRAPYGHYNPLLVIQLIRKGYKFVHWNSDTSDYAMKSNSELVSWFARQAFTKEDIILMHDNHTPAAFCLSEAITAVAKNINLKAIPMTGFVAGKTE